MEFTKELLDEWVEKINVPEYVESDPVQFPRRFSRQEDVEISAFLAAILAWGKRSLILKSAEGMFERMGDSPYEYILSEGYLNLGTKNIHRTFFERDLLYFCKGFAYIYQKYGHLELLFANRATVWEGMDLFRDERAKANEGLYSKHISHAGAGSACKRLNLALKWLVRSKGPVDLGVWTRLDAAQLMIPLDVHVGRVSRALGLLQRRQNDRKAVEELTAKLRGFDPSDPVRYDFALFGLGLAGITGGKK